MFCERLAKGSPTLCKKQIRKGRLPAAFEIGHFFCGIELI
jgi:hypothetical protein